MTEQLIDRLHTVLDAMGTVAVAVSGGVDSMTLAVVAHRRNPATQMFHALSAAVPVAATDRVREYAHREGWQLQLVDAGEIRDPDYVANPANRCYFCKTNLYDEVQEHTDLTVVSGTNLDDLGDYRPGLIAAEEHAVRHPYVEAGISKAALRSIAADLGLDDLKDLPAAPCLSSRVTTGIEIDPALLPVIDTVEVAVRAHLEDALDLAGVRCRIRPDHVEIEIEATPAITGSEAACAGIPALVSGIFTDAGYPHYASVRIAPYKRGSAFLIDAVSV